MATGSYSWLNLSTAIAQLSQRLADPTNQFWSIPELTFYLQQSLRQYNALTGTWRQDFVFINQTPAPYNVWTNLGSLAGSPRLRTITDSYCYSEMEYMLLEPSTAGVWTGTSQFTISDLSQALQRRRDEMIQISNCNQVLLPNIALTPNTIRTFLPDTIIDVERVRYIPAQVSPDLQPPPPTTLYRDDTIANEFYEAPLYEQNPGTPQTFSLTSEPPLSWQVDIPPAQPGTYEAVVLQSGAPFNPPASTLIGIPDDTAWILENGALADLLGRDSEATDRERAAYCQKRYQDGLQLMMKAPWVELGKINGQAVSLDSIYATDRYSPNWDSQPLSFGPVIVVGGTDMVATPVNQGVGLTVVGNAPVPSVGTDFLQVSRSNWEIVILLAQCRSLFKMGGAEWKSGLDMEKEAILACANENTRLRSTGAFSDILVQRGGQQERDMNRFNSANKK